MNKNNNSFIVSHLQLHELKDYLNNFKEISYKVQENYLKYMDLYYGSVFKNLSFKVQTDNNIIYCPLTLQKENIQKINFYTFPVEIFSEKEIDKELNNFLVKYFTNLKKENNISNILFKIRKKNDRSIAENDTINLNKTISEIFINLNLSNLEIKKNFKQSLRTILNKKYDFLEYIVIDKKNYQKNEILKMRDLHIKVSGRETRTKDAWYQNEKMILDGNGFIIKVIYQNKTISYSFFYFNNITCVYFASCTLGEYFKIIKNIGHNSIWHAINYVKNKCGNFYIGSIAKYSKHKLSNKELNIEKFRKQFNRVAEDYHIYNDIPKFF